MSPRPRRSEQIYNLQEAIKETAWRQIAEVGAPALSLRAIARELHITAPAIYNYYPDRDALVTALVIDAFTSFGDAQLAARDSIPEEDLPGRLKAIGLAYRTWAHAYPQRYQLMFGTPVPGYKEPKEEVVPASTRSIRALFSVIESIRAAGRLNLDYYPKISNGYQKRFYAIWNQNIGDVHPLSVFMAMLFWARVHGIVSLEIQGNLPPFGEEGDALYRAELGFMVEQFVKG